MGGFVALTKLRGKLHYIQNQTRLEQCACEPMGQAPLNVLLAVSNGMPDDIDGATNYLRNLGWTDNTCVEIQGTPGLVGVNVNVFYLTKIANCPIGPCNA
jgi:hypothetical protein